MGCSTSNYSNFIIDSGTSNVYIPTGPYNALVAAIKAAVPTIPATAFQNYYVLLTSYQLSLMPDFRIR